MPDSAPEEYKKRTEQCCDADSDKRLNVNKLWENINNVTRKFYNHNSDDNIRNIIYCNDVRPLSHLRKRVNIRVDFTYRKFA